MFLLYKRFEVRFLLVAVPRLPLKVDDHLGKGPGGVVEPMKHHVRKPCAVKEHHVALANPRKKSDLGEVDDVQRLDGRAVVAKHQVDTALPDDGEVPKHVQNLARDLRQRPAVAVGDDGLLDRGRLLKLAEVVQDLAWAPRIRVFLQELFVPLRERGGPGVLVHLVLALPKVLELVDELIDDLKQPFQRQLERDFPPPLDDKLKQLDEVVVRVDLHGYRGLVDPVQVANGILFVQHLKQAVFLAKRRYGGHVRPRGVLVVLLLLVFEPEEVVVPQLLHVP